MTVALSETQIFMLRKFQWNWIIWQIVNLVARHFVVTCPNSFACYVDNSLGDRSDGADVLAHDSSLPNCWDRSMRPLQALCHNPSLGG